MKIEIGGILFTIALLIIAFHGEPDLVDALINKWDNHSDPEIKEIKCGLPIELFLTGEEYTFIIESQSQNVIVWSNESPPRMFTCEEPLT